MTPAFRKKPIHESRERLLRRCPALCSATKKPVTLAASAIRSVAPRNGNYRHNDFSVRTVNMTEDECPNGHAHCQHLLLSTSESVPIIGGEPQLGQYQRIFFVELDRPRSREVLVQVLGA